MDANTHRTCWELACSNFHIVEGKATPFFKKGELINIYNGTPSPGNNQIKDELNRMIDRRKINDDNQNMRVEWVEKLVEGIPDGDEQSDSEQYFTTISVLVSGIQNLLSSSGDRRGLLRTWYRAERQFLPRNVNEQNAPDNIDLPEEIGQFLADNAEGTGSYTPPLTIRGYWRQSLLLQWEMKNGAKITPASMSALNSVKSVTTGEIGLQSIRVVVQILSRAKMATELDEWLSAIPNPEFQEEMSDRFSEIRRISDIIKKCWNVSFTPCNEESTTRFAELCAKIYTIENLGPDIANDRREALERAFRLFGDKLINGNENEE